MIFELTLDNLWVVSNQTINIVIFNSCDYEKYIESYLVHTHVLHAICFIDRRCFSGVFIVLSVLIMKLTHVDQTVTQWTRNDTTALVGVLCHFCCPIYRGHIMGSSPQ